MGQTTSHFSSVGMSNRATQFVKRKRKSSSCPSSSKDSPSNSLPSTASSSRLPSIESEDSHSMIISQRLKENNFQSSSEKLTQYELNLVYTSWQNVISDSSNICLNFFQQIKNIKKVREGKKGRTEASMATKPNFSSPICQPTSKFLQKGSKHNDLIYYALRLSCCIDRLIFKIRIEDLTPVSTNEKYYPDYSLDEKGELLEFLNLCSLSDSELDRLILLFVDTVKLVTTYSQKSLWSEDVHRAWVKVLKILINELKGY